MKPTNYNYKVYDRNGTHVMSAPESCRYSPKTERDLLESGYTIKINGKKLTKKEVQNGN